MYQSRNHKLFFFTMDGSLIPNKWLLPLLSNFSPWNSLFQAFRLEGRPRDVRTKISQGRPSHWTPGPCYTPKAKAMFTLDTFCADTIKIWIGILLTHWNGDFSAISVTERGALLRQIIKWTVTYRIGIHTFPDSFSCKHEETLGIVWT